jgi:hypothetical protein
MTTSTLCGYWMYKRLWLLPYWPQQSPQHLFLQHAIRYCNLRSPRPLRKGSYRLFWTWWVYPILIIVVEHFIDFLSATYFTPNGVSSCYHPQSLCSLVFFLKIVGSCGTAIQNSDFSVALNDDQFGIGAPCGRSVRVSCKHSPLNSPVRDDVEARFFL